MGRDDSLAVGDGTTGTTRPLPVSTALNCLPGSRIAHDSEATAGMHCEHVREPDIRMESLALTRQTTPPPSRCTPTGVRPL
jgi:hypothetical protein